MQAADVSKLRELLDEAQELYAIDEEQVLVLQLTETRITFIARTKSEQLLFVTTLFIFGESMKSFTILDTVEENKLRDWMLGQ